MKKDFIYMAGFFDGEGCIRINKRVRPKNPEYTLLLTVGQKDGAIMDWVIENFGGFIHRVKRDNSFMWIATNKQAVSVLEKITPYLKYKKPQALLALTLHKNFRKKNPIPKEEIERREKIYLEMSRLKKIFSNSMFAVQRLNELTRKGCNSLNTIGI